MKRNLELAGPPLPPIPGYRLQSKVIERRFQSITDPRKRAYSIAYYKWRVLEMGREDSPPEPPKGLSEYYARAIRRRIAWMVKPTVLASWYFRSQSDPTKIYRTVQRDAMTPAETLSCDCPGWTRRVQPDGSRMCVHTRLVMGGSPKKDPLFISCDAYAELELNTQDPYPTQRFIPSPSESQRQGSAFTSFDDMSPTWINYFKREGCCLVCGYFHFPEYRACSGMRGEPQRTMTRSKPTPEPKPKSLTVPPKRKFYFED